MRLTWISYAEAFNSAGEHTHTVWSRAVDGGKRVFVCVPRREEPAADAGGYFSPYTAMECRNLPPGGEPWRVTRAS